jgi:hypothetical protein
MISQILAKKLLDEIEEANPDIKYGYKDEPPQTLLISMVYLLVNLVSKVSPSVSQWFYRGSVTILGDWVLFPNHLHNVFETTMPENTYIILRHELVHMKQRNKHRFWEPRYLFSAPIFYTERAKWEMEAYKETLQAIYEVYNVIPAKRVSDIVDLFVGWKYGYMKAPWKRVDVYVELQTHCQKLREKKNVR